VNKEALICTTNAANHVKVFYCTLPVATDSPTDTISHVADTRSCFRPMMPELQYCIFVLKYISDEFVPHFSLLFLLS